MNFFAVCMFIPFCRKYTRIRKIVIVILYCFDFDRSIISSSYKIMFLIFFLCLYGTVVFIQIRTISLILSQKPQICGLEPVQYSSFSVVQATKANCENLIKVFKYATFSSLQIIYLQRVIYVETVILILIIYYIFDDFKKSQNVYLNWEIISRQAIYKTESSAY